MNSKIKKLICIFVLTCITVVLCIYANDLVVKFFVLEDAAAVKVKMVDYSEIPDQAVCVLKGEGELGDFLEKYQIDGAAFCEMEAGSDNSNRIIELFLVSENNAYKIEAGSAIRVDVYFDFEDTLKMANGEIGFQAEFSTINIANGVYELKAYVRENEEICGLSSFGVYYEKDANGFRKL